MSEPLAELERQVSFWRNTSLGLKDEMIKRGYHIEELNARIRELEAALTDLRTTGCYPLPQIASGQVTAEWNTPEEDDAWKHLEDDNG